MKRYRIIINDCHIENGKLVISNCGIIKAGDGEYIRDININDSFMEMMKNIEIDIDTFQIIEIMKTKNHNFTKLIQSFRLYT